jgi:hypothetical protein
VRVRVRVRRVYGGCRVSEWVKLRRPLAPARQLRAPRQDKPVPVHQKEPQHIGRLLLPRKVDIVRYPSPPCLSESARLRRPSRV